MDGYVGIDIIKAQLDVMLLHGGQREGHRFTNSATGYEKLHKWVSRRVAVGQVHVCLEATGWYGEKG